MFQSWNQSLLKLFRSSLCKFDSIFLDIQIDFEDCTNLERRLHLDTLEGNLFMSTWSEFG